MVDDDALESRWEKVAATRRMQEESSSSCRWLLFLDADAVVVDVARGPEPLLRRMQAHAHASTVMYAACNSPIGRGLDCDAICCGRASRPSGCSVGLRDGGPAIPYPCLINSGVFFVKAGAAGRALVREWEGHQRTQREAFGEQVRPSMRPSAPHPQHVRPPVRPAALSAPHQPPARPSVREQESLNIVKQVSHAGRTHAHPRPYLLLTVRPSVQSMCGRTFRSSSRW